MIHLFLTVVCVLFLLAAAAYCWKATGTSPLYWRVSMSLVPLAQMLVILVLSQLSSFTNQDIAHLFLMALACVLCGFADGIVANRLKVSADKQQLEERRRVVLQELEQGEGLANLMVRHSRSLDESYGKVRLQLQEISDKIDAAQMGQAMDQLYGTIAKLEAESAKKLCMHKTVDAVLQLKAEQCADMDIAFQCDALVPPDCGIDEVILCGVFSNLLDNAIHAAQVEEGPARFVRVAAAKKGEYLVIKVTNGCTRPFGSLMDRKLSPVREHGWGLQIVERLAAQQNGMFDIVYDQDLFAAVATAALACP